MFAFRDQRFLDILLLVLGFFGVLWFFYDLKNHHPLSAIEITMNAEEAISMADSIFYNWQFEPENLKKRARVTADDDLINRIQSEFGRDKYLSNNDSENYQILPLYTWSVEEFQLTKEDIETAVTFDLSKDGELVSFDVSNDVIVRQTPFNRKLIRLAFGNTPDYSVQKEDSIIANLIDFQHQRSLPTNIYVARSRLVSKQ